jgi:hypothetical protein
VHIDCSIIVACGVPWVPIWTLIDTSRSTHAKRRISAVPALIDKMKTTGDTSVEAQQQLALETELLHLLEAQVVAN